MLCHQVTPLELGCGGGEKVLLNLKKQAFSNEGGVQLRNDVIVAFAVWGVKAIESLSLCICQNLIYFPPLPAIGRKIFSKRLF
jgi:hypothetical protein